MLTTVNTYSVRFSHTALRAKGLPGPQVATSGAQPGNANYRKGRLFADAINRALELPSRHERLKRIEAIADKLVTMAEDGDIQAIREVADRLDGKPAQTIQGDADNPLTVNQIIRKVVDGA